MHSCDDRNEDDGRDYQGNPADYSRDDDHGEHDHDECKVSMIKDYCPFASRLETGVHPFHATGNDDC